MTAIDGSARQMIDELMASETRRPVWPIHSPTGSAMAIAIKSDDERDADVLGEADRDAVRAAPVDRVGQPRDGLADDVHGLVGIVVRP